jgi:2'-5' RNA ligase
MRLFIAIDCNTEKEYFKHLQAELPKEGVKLSLTNDFHITLKFLGEVMPHKVDTLKEALHSVGFSPFSFSLGNIGVFPSERSPRVVWVGVDPEEHAIQLQKHVEKALHGIFEKEKHFEPHITLARVKHVAYPSQFMGKMKSITVEKKSIVVDKFHLVKSTLTPKGAMHESIFSTGKQ